MKNILLLTSALFRIWEQGACMYVSNLRLLISIKLNRYTDMDLQESKVCG